MSEPDELKTSLGWSKYLRKGVIIYDPDGWDRKNYDFSFNRELINKREFEHRFVMSTVQMPNDGKGIWAIDNIAKEIRGNHE